MTNPTSQPGQSSSPAVEAASNWIKMLDKINADWGRLNELIGPHGTQVTSWAILHTLAVRREEIDHVTAFANVWADYGTNTAMITAEKIPSGLPCLREGTGAITEFLSDEIHQHAAKTSDLAYSLAGRARQILRDYGVEMTRQFGVQWQAVLNTAASLVTWLEVARDDGHVTPTGDPLIELGLTAAAPAGQTQP